MLTTLRRGCSEDLHHRRSKTGPKFLRGEGAKTADQGCFDLHEPLQVLLAVEVEMVETTSLLERIATVIEMEQHRGMYSVFRLWAPMKISWSLTLVEGSLSPGRLVRG
jgi:hypothetical protein